LLTIIDVVLLFDAAGPLVIKVVH